MRDMDADVRLCLVLYFTPGSNKPDLCHHLAPQRNGKSKLAIYVNYETVSQSKEEI